ILFDAVGTLIFPRPAAADVYFEVGRRFGSRLQVLEIARRFRAVFAEEDEIDRRAGFQTSEEREEERWRRIVSKVLDDISDTDACFRQLFNHFAEPRSWRFDPRIENVFAELASRGYLLAQASNFDGRLRGIVAALPGLARLHPLVISSEVGWRKPAPEFF